MFNKLTYHLAISINKLRGLRRLTEDNIQSTLREIRNALLEADVASTVVNNFIKQVREQVIGQEIIKNVRPGDVLIKKVQDELRHILGDKKSDLNLNAKLPVTIIMTGLQGSGKTTTVAKLALWLQDTQKRSVLVASADIYRPAAIEQLEILAQKVHTQFFRTEAYQKPTDIAAAALRQAEKQLVDVLILDTAGRLHINDELMQEMKEISDIMHPTELLLVVDSMMGQDAANVAKSFNDALSLTGVILTKAEGDARGGAALSMRMITEKPIKFIGIGEKMDDFEPFYPGRMASRILGMGDIVSLVEEAQRKIDKKHAEKIAQSIKKGKRFNFEDFLIQLQQIRKIGGLESLLDKLPIMAKIPKGTAMLFDDKLLVKMQAIIQSMTLKERHFPTLINGSRKRRISSGSGTTPQDVNKLLKQFDHMQKIVKRSINSNQMAKRSKQVPRQVQGRQRLN
ncbi:signal recognition particle protein [Coxiella endosymbiont of Amblyomma nuttalli]|uniref:signal recognition particle protein n=1 Tax=Coxiella endosymbiont of Amblyomma nuttalli TaxID=2749996 RepID=UPI001BA9D32B